LKSRGYCDLQGQHSGGNDYAYYHDITGSKSAQYLYNFVELLNTNDKPEKYRVALQELTDSDHTLMKYKSTPHYVVLLSGTGELKGEVPLPYMKYKGELESDAEILDGKDNVYTGSYTSSDDFFTKPFGKSIFKRNDINVDYKCPYGYLWLGEFYRKSVNNRFGGNSETALESNVWLPCGKTVSLENLKEE
jgi:hypothetical protein